MLIICKSDIRPPTAPVLGTPIAMSTTVINVPLSTASTDVGGVASYSLERATSAAGPFAEISSAATFPYSSSGLTAATTYYYRARATDVSGNVGPYSAIVSQTTQSSGGNPANSATLTWTAPAQFNNGSPANIAGYNIYVGSSDANVALITTVGPSPLTYTFSGLVAGTYYFAVKAVDSNGVEGDMSAYATKVIT